jgi:hypothetical protein
VDAARPSAADLDADDAGREPSDIADDAMTTSDAGLTPAPIPVSEGGGDATPPRIVATAPADGARGVSADVVLSITFDEAMDRASVEGAYTSDDLPRASVVFTWTTDGRELRVTPRAPLEYAEGAEPNLAARSYFFGFVAGARDTAGNALSPSTFAFSTLRQLTERSGALQDRALTGNFRGDGVYGSNGCEREQARVCVGDSGVALNVQSKGFVSFAPLGSEVRQALVGAHLELRVENIVGAPFSGLGALQIEPVSFVAIGTEAFAAPATGAARTLATSAFGGGTLRVDVLELLPVPPNDAAAPQFRLRFASSSDLDGNPDMLLLESVTPVLEVTYLIP